MNIESLCDLAKDVEKDPYKTIILKYCVLSFKINYLSNSLCAI